MTALLLPTPRAATRHPGVRGALLLLAAGPPSVAWWGQAAEAPIRLRVLGMALAVVVALSWDDRAYVLTASTPVGLPAVRRGRALVVLAIAVAAFALAWALVPVPVPVAALALQSAGLAALLLAVVGWFGRDGDPVLVLPVPALLLSLVVLSRLPASVGMLRADPQSPQWAAERTRWWVLLALCLLAVAWLQRDPAARALRQRARIPLS